MEPQQGSYLSKPPGLISKTQERKQKKAAPKRPRHGIVERSQACREAVRTLADSLGKLPSNDVKSAESPLRANLTRSIMSGFVSSGQVCKVLLPTEPLNITSSAGTFAVVYGISLSTVSGYTDWQAAFAEYRITSFTARYRPSFVGSYNPQGGMFGGGVRWSTTNSPPTSFSDAIQTDGSVIQGLHVPHDWHGDLTRYYGELDWLNTASQATNVFVAVLMAPVASSGVTGSNMYGALSCDVTIEFRGLT